MCAPNGSDTPHILSETTNSESSCWRCTPGAPGLVERALCLREHTPAGTLLIFPSYYRRERKELTGHPAVLVSYRFHGFLA